MAVIGPSLKWLEQHLFSPASSKDSSSSVERKITESSFSLPSVRLLPSYSPSSGCTAETKLLSTRNGFQKGLSSGEGLKDDHEYDGIRFRRHYHQDIA